jgi:hypothetical protein
MFGIGTFLLVVLGLGGFVVLIGVGTFLFQASCALADVPERGYFRSLPIYAVAVVVCLPLAGSLIWFAGRYDTDPNDSFGSLRIVALIGSLLLVWLVSAGIYVLFLSASLKKGLLIAAVELVLLSLLAAFVSAIVLVILALVQIISRPPPVKTDLAPLPILRVASSIPLP